MLRKEPKNLLNKSSTQPITCIAIRLRDLYERPSSEKENKIMNHSPLFLNYKRNIQGIIKVTFRLCASILVGYSRYNTVLLGNLAVES